MCSLKSHVVIPTALVLSQSFYLLRWHEREHPPRELVRSSARRGRGERQELPSQEAVREKQLGGGGRSQASAQGLPETPGFSPPAPGAPRVSRRGDRLMKITHRALRWGSATGRGARGALPRQPLRQGTCAWQRHCL